MNKPILFTFLFFILINADSFSQSSTKPKLFLTAGYGLAGSFFVRSYQEFAPVQRYKTFYKKDFIGVCQNATLGWNLNKFWEARIGINFQHFTKNIKSLDTLNNVQIDLNHDIHHRDYMWFGSLARKFEDRTHLVALGLGVYYLRPKQQEVEVFYPNYFGDVERDFKNSRLNELGAFTELAYEYKFQPKVNLGVKTQFYFTISAGYAESITLFPYIKILF